MNYFKFQLLLLFNLIIKLVQEVNVEEGTKLCELDYAFGIRMKWDRDDLR